MGSNNSKNNPQKNDDPKQIINTKQNVRKIQEPRVDVSQTNDTSNRQNNEEEMKQYKFEYIDESGRAKEAQIKGSFDGFTNEHKMRQAKPCETTRNNRFILYVKASKDLHKFQFIVDGKVQVSKDYKVIKDENSKYSQNCVDLRDFAKEKEKEIKEGVQDLKHYQSQNFEQLNEMLKEKSVPKLPDAYKNNYLAREVIESQTKIISEGAYVIKAESNYINQDQSIPRMRPNHTQLDHCCFTKPKSENLYVQALSNRIRNKTLTIFYQTKDKAKYKRDNKDDLFEHDAYDCNFNQDLEQDFLDQDQDQEDKVPNDEMKITQKLSIQVSNDEIDKLEREEFLELNKDKVNEDE